MNRHLYFARGRRSGFTLKELLVVIVVIGVLMAILIPAVQMGREATRRCHCCDMTMQVSSAVHNYAQANQSQFPPGTICSSKPTQPGNQYDVWGEAGNAEPGNHGTSFLLRILPFIEEDALLKVWASGRAGSGTTAGCWSPAANIGTEDAPGPAVTNIYLYCPSRRNGLRWQDGKMMLSPEWTGGGTDYGGCVGRHAAFTLETGYNQCDATTHYKPEYCPTHPQSGVAIENTAKSRLGIFGKVNESTTFGQVRDGTSNTIMIGELQRITDITPGSKDGWSVGGPATLFTTGALVKRDESTLTFVDSPTSGRLSNNGFFGSPGSEHPGGANYGLGDGSVRFFTDSMDPSILTLMGSMADGLAPFVDY
jgi:prepilin-type N-terminal cleavage/methylation domain-containing protein/prepilin-type processing-associated H-X9-DG protein